MKFIFTLCFIAILSSLVACQIPIQCGPHISRLRDNHKDQMEVLKSDFEQNHTETEKILKYQINQIKNESNVCLNNLQNCVKSNSNIKDNLNKVLREKSEVESQQESCLGRLNDKLIVLEKDKKIHQTLDFSGNRACLNDGLVQNPSLIGYALIDNPFCSLVIFCPYIILLVHFLGKLFKWCAKKECRRRCSGFSNCLKHKKRQNLIIKKKQGLNTEKMQTRNISTPLKNDINEIGILPETGNELNEVQVHSMPFQTFSQAVPIPTTLNGLPSFISQESNSFATLNRGKIRSGLAGIDGKRSTNFGTVKICPSGTKI